MRQNGRIPPRLTGRVQLILARPEGLEPPAYWFEANRSIQLSYGRVLSLYVPHRVEQGDEPGSLRHRSSAEERARDLALFFDRPSSRSLLEKLVRRPEQGKTGVLPYQLSQQLAPTWDKSPDLSSSFFNKLLNK